MRVKSVLANLRFQCAESQSNFLLAQVPAADTRYECSEHMAREFYQRLKDDGILIRYFDQPRLRDKLRITIGTFEENQRLLQCLESYLAIT